MCSNDVLINSLDIFALANFALITRKYVKEMKKNNNFGFFSFFVATVKKKNLYLEYCVFTDKYKKFYKILLSIKSDENEQQQNLPFNRNRWCGHRPQYRMYPCFYVHQLGWDYVEILFYLKKKK